MVGAMRRPIGNTKLKCISCGARGVSCLDSRVTDDNVIRRRRLCSACGARWTTYEHQSAMSRYSESSKVRETLMRIATIALALAQEMEGGE